MASVSLAAVRKSITDLSHCDEPHLRYTSRLPEALKPQIPRIEPRFATRACSSIRLVPENEDHH